MLNDLSLPPINVRLCGSIPRKELALVDRDDDDVVEGGAPWSLRACLTSGLGPSYFARTNGPTLAPTAMPPHCASAATMRGSLPSMTATEGPIVEARPPCPVVEPPAWAVPAKGETRLEPVCEATGRQSPVDLTQQACFRIGRSPNADVQLFHATSSRRHAMMFHHENGSCYIVDCGSAHGTYLNGQRITAPTPSGVSVPHKVKRGALVRFGGPGAPCFVLKSFSFDLKEMNEAAYSQDEMGMVRRNTRLNALGESASSVVRSRMAVSLEMALVVSRKRSFDSLDSRDTIDIIPVDKRARCTSPELSPPSPLRLVSPDLPMIAKTRVRRVTFSPEAPRVFHATMAERDAVLSDDE